MLIPSFELVYAALVMATIQENNSDQLVKFNLKIGQAEVIKGLAEIQSFPSLAFIGFCKGHLISMGSFTSLLQLQPWLAKNAILIWNEVYGERDEISKQQSKQYKPCVHGDYTALNLMVKVPNSVE